MALFFGVFKNVSVALIFVVVWHNKEWLTKSQTFRLLVIIWMYVYRLYNFLTLLIVFSHDLYKRRKYDTIVLLEYCIILFDICWKF